jgi:phosphoribosylamine--glycine ligase
LEELHAPYVLKADGLAGGKGVLILNSLDEAKRELAYMLGENKFGEAGNKVVIEEFMNGIEASIFVITDGKNYKILPNAKDYKRIGEGDTGLNTGGMGAISPVPFVDADFMQKTEERIIKPTINGLFDEGIIYKGFIYFGLMNVGGEPFVVEYNVRLGDPEAEVIVPRIQSDLIEMFATLENEELDSYELVIDPRAASTIVVASEGYPQNYVSGFNITGLNDVKDSIVFHAGTKRDDERILSNGGRVLAVTSFGRNLEESLKKGYESIKKIYFEGMYYRSDIGFDVNKN